MFLQFSVNNFRSIKDTVTFSMNASSSSDGNHRFHINNHALLSSAVIYGANASGKSNVLRAMGFMRNLVLNKANNTLPHEPFLLNTETEYASSYFEILFFFKTVKYRYGFEADSTTVYAEWLYSEKEDNETCLFDRDTENNHPYINKQKFKEGLDLKVADNNLFIWQCEKNNGEISKKIMHWFTGFNLIDSLENTTYFYIALNKMKNTRAKVELLKLVKAAGFSIEALVIEEYDVTEDFINNAPFSNKVKQKILHDGSLKSIELKTRHKKYNAERCWYYLRVEGNPYSCWHDRIVYWIKY